MTRPPRKESPKTNVSPSSGYLLYGRGRQEDYEREVQRVKTELARDLYGDPKAPKAKKINAAAIIIFFATIASILVMVAFAILQKMGQVVGTRGVVGIVQSVVDGLADLTLDATTGSCICICVACLFIVTTMIGSAFSIKRAHLGKLMLTGTVIWSAVLIALTVIETTVANTLPIEELILTLIAVIAMICAIAGRKRKGGK